MCNEFTANEQTSTSTTQQLQVRSCIAFITVLQYLSSIGFVEELKNKP